MSECVYISMFFESMYLCLFSSWCVCICVFLILSGGSLLLLCCVGVSVCDCEDGGGCFHISDSAFPCMFMCIFELTNGSYEVFRKHT